MGEPRNAHEALRAAGYHCFGPQPEPIGEGEILWQRRTPEGRLLIVNEWPPIGGRIETCFEVDAYADTTRVKLSSYPPSVLAERLWDLERRVLAVLAALDALETRPWERDD